MFWKCPNCGAENKHDGICVSEGCYVVFPQDFKDLNPFKQMAVEKAKEAVIKAAIKLSDTQEVVEMMVDLKGTESLDAPVEFMELYYSVQDLKKAST